MGLIDDKVDKFSQLMKDRFSEEERQETIEIFEFQILRIMIDQTCPKAREMAFEYLKEEMESREEEE